MVVLQKNLPRLQVTFVPFITLAVESIYHFTFLMLQKIKKALYSWPTPWCLFHQTCVCYYLASFYEQVSHTKLHNHTKLITYPSWYDVSLCVRDCLSIKAIKSLLPYSTRVLATTDCSVLNTCWTNLVCGHNLQSTHILCSVCKKWNHNYATCKCNYA